MINKIVILTVLLLSALIANEAIIENVEVQKGTDGSFSFQVRILHKDSGWEHYVDGYEVLDAEGDVLGTRKLWHPHEHEQPFTRGLSGVRIKGDTVYIRAHDSVDGYSKSYRVKLIQ